MYDFDEYQINVDERIWKERTPKMDNVSRLPKITRREQPDPEEIAEITNKVHHGVPISVPEVNLYLNEQKRLWEERKEVSEPSTEEQILQIYARRKREDEIKVREKQAEMAAREVEAKAKTEKKTCLEKASDVVDGARQKSYGHPFVNHGTTAEYWTTYLTRRFPGIVITAEDVCMMQILMKISREGNSHNPDNLVDIPGYARNIEMVMEYREKQKEEAKKSNNSPDVERF